MESTTQDVATGLRGRKKLATKQALAFTAMQLAVERGLENVRVEDITDAVNVSRRTFANYFSSKEEAIASLNADRAAEAAQALRDRPAAESLAEALAGVFAAQYEAGSHGMDQQRARLVQLLTTSPALRGEYLKTQAEAEGPLAAAIAERTGHDLPRDLYPHVLAGAAIAAVRVATGHWLAHGGAGSLPDVIRQAVRQVTLPVMEPQPGPKAARSLS
jgi:AcrR family transcriptional regulator